MELIEVLIISLLVQQVVEVVKKAIKLSNGFAYCFNRVNLKVLIAIVISIVVCISSDIGIFGLLGVNVAPVFDNVLTGILSAGGSSTIQDLIKKIKDVKKGA